MQENTKQYNVRLLKSFTMPQHRRAGHVFVPGPEPQTVDLTSEQYEMIDNDPSLEFVDEQEATKRRALSPKRAEKTKPQVQPRTVEPAQTTPNDTTTGRRYAGTAPKTDTAPRNNKEK